MCLEFGRVGGVSKALGTCKTTISRSSSTIGGVSSGFLGDDVSWVVHEARIGGSLILCRNQGWYLDVKETAL